MVTFHELLDASPELAEMRDNARSIAHNRRWPWYEQWLDDNDILRTAVNEAAEALGLPSAVVKAVAVRGLLDTYHTAKARLTRQKAGRDGEAKR